MLTGHAKIHFYIPRYKQEFIDFLLHHSNIKPHKLKKMSIDHVRRIYYAIRIKQVESELQTSLESGKHMKDLTDSNKKEAQQWVKQQQG